MIQVNLASMMSQHLMNLPMSNANKDLLSKRFNEYKEEISTEPTRRKLNDHALLIDGLNTFIRAFSINPSLNEHENHLHLGTDLSKRL
jgi:hypothetical protein